MRVLNTARTSDKTEYYTIQKPSDLHSNTNDDANTLYLIRADVEVA